MKIISESTLTCPKCGFHETLIMPTDACQFFHKCKQCSEILKPNQGDCCVFCSFGDVVCPPKQQEKT